MNEEQARKHLLLIYPAHTLDKDDGQTLDGFVDKHMKAMTTRGSWRPFAAEQYILELESRIQMD